MVPYMEPYYKVKTVFWFPVHRSIVGPLGRFHGGIGQIWRVTAQESSNTSATSGSRMMTLLPYGNREELEAFLQGSSE